MIDWIPLPYYTSLYYYIMLLVVCWVFFRSQINQQISSSENNHWNRVGILVLVFVVLYMGLRPISGRYFGDMGTYANIFLSYQAGFPITSSKDILFHLFMQQSSNWVGVHTFFFLCTLLYIMPLYLVCKKWFSKYWFFGFIMLITAFSFWAAGTNGIRSAIAGSLFLLGISRDKRILQIVWLAIAVTIHLSLLLPVLLFVIVQFYNKPKWVIIFWFLCIPLSLLFTGFWENLFANLGFEDDRMSYFTDEIDATQFSAVGFRWDFLLYSFVGVFAGWYFIFKKEFKDPMYFQLFNVYALANAFWILVINSNFSNRFAYLSWFLLALVIIYPLLKQNILKNQYKKIGLIVLTHFLFTFFMFLILG